MASQTISQAFPHSQSRIAESSQDRYIYGIEPIYDRSQCDSDPLQQEFQSLALEREQLEKKEKELRLKVQELEQLREAEYQKLDDQMQQLLEPSNAIFHGPDTIEHFNDFSIDKVMSEIRKNAPDVLDLFQSLATCDQVDEDDNEDDSKQLKVMSSICTLLQSHSVDVRGVQLLLTFMLIAHGTCAQVN